MPEHVASTAAPPFSAALQGIRRDIGISRERMARLLDVSAKTIERWEEREKPPPNATARQRLLKLGQIVDLGLQVYTPEAFRAFLTLPMPVFHGRTALQFVELGEFDRVYGVVVSDYEGGGY